MIKETLVGLVQQLCPSVLRHPVTTAALEEGLSYFPCLLSHYKEVLFDGSRGIVCNNGVKYEFQWILTYLRMINQLKVVQ